MVNQSRRRAASRSVRFAHGLAVLTVVLIAVPASADDPTLPPPPPEEYVAPEVTDLSGDEVEDLMLVSPLGDDPSAPGGSPGKVVIESGAGGSMMTLSGGQNNDWFGYSVAVIPDLNFDGFDELLVGAPRHGTGRAYLFYGPFNDIGVEELTVADADYTFSSPHAGVYNFGAKVAPLHDVSNDDMHDLRIKSFFTNPQGQPVMRTYIYSGLTLELLTSIIGDAPFDPWLVIDGDTDNDADVDGDDLNTVIANQGLTGNLTRFDGDLNGDGTVNAVDLAIVTGGQGQAHFAGHVGGGGSGGGAWGGPWAYSLGCGSGDCYFYNCDCELVCSADCECPECEGGDCMSWLDCNPEQCPGGGCAVYIEHEPEGTVQCVFEDMTLHASGPPESEGGYLWGFITGASLVQMQGPLGGQTIHFRLKKLGKIKPKVYRNWCGGCEDQDLIFSVWIDSDDDGLPDAIEDDLGTSPTDPDSDGDGVSDGQEDFDGDGLINGSEISLGFDPTDPDSDGDGTPDGQDNPPPGGGVQPPNCGSFEQDINLAWMCGDPVSADGPITVCEDDAVECDCWTFHVTDEAGGTDDFWFVVGNPQGASIDGDPDQDRTSPCFDFDGPGSFEVGVISQLGGAFCMATQTINIVKVDLDIVGVADDEEENPGGYVRINGDNDNGSPWVTGTTNTIPTIRDLETHPVPSENDMLPVQLSMQPDELEGEIRLRVIFSGEGRIKLWDSASKQAEIELTDGQVAFQAEELPTQVYLEGVENSAVLRDVEIVVDFIPAGEQDPACSDQVKLTVTPVVTSFTATTGSVFIAQAPDGTYMLAAFGPTGPPVNGIEFSSSASVTNFAGQGSLVFVQNVVDETGTATFTPASGLAPVAAAYGSEPFTDLNGNGQWDAAEPFIDENENGQYDPGEPFTDLNGNGQWDAAEPFVDVNFDGQYDAQYSFPMLDAEHNPPPAANIFAAGPGEIVAGIATLGRGDSPSVPFPVQNPNLIQSIDVTQEFEMWVAWWFADGSIWPLASIEWEVRYEAVRVPLPGGGTHLTLGPQAGVTADPMTRNHVDPWVVPPVANLAGEHWE